IAFSIIEQHKGWIDVTSELGRGTTLRLYLPVGTPSQQATHDQSLRRSERGSETILLVEDDAPARRLMRRVLEGHGYPVVDGQNSPPGWRVWDREGGRIDLVLPEVRMPGGVDGVELARALKSPRAGLKVIFATGYARTITAEMLDRQERLVHKPILPHDLLA